MTADDMIYFQSLSKKATVFYAIADVEAYNDNGLSLQESSKIAIQNVADILALGLDPERAIVYKQSQEIRVMRLATIFSAGVTNNMLRAIYGERQVGLYLSALIQAGDILMPQLPEFGGPKPVVVPVGADQDPHIRLSRDLANSFHKDFGFIPPSSIYHKLIKSLDGATKMSKRSAGLVLHPRRGPFIGGAEGDGRVHRGRPTVEEQRRIGGEADKCPIYDLYLFHFALEDEYAKRVYDECYGGVRMCGDCKKELATLVKKYPRGAPEEARVVNEGRRGAAGEEQEDLGLDGTMSETERTPLHPIERKVLTALSAGNALEFDSLVQLHRSCSRPGQALAELAQLQGARDSRGDIDVHARRDEATEPPELLIVSKLEASQGFAPDGRAEGSVQVESGVLCGSGPRLVHGMDIDRPAAGRTHRSAQGPGGRQETSEPPLEARTEAWRRSKVGPEFRMLIVDLLKRGLAGPQGDEGHDDNDNQGRCRSARVDGEGVLRREAHARSSSPRSGPQGAEVKLRPIDVRAPAASFFPGRRHPVKEFINEVREVYLSMGFVEIAGNSIQSSFWNFDALFTPQDHPARELQDTFYIKGGRDESSSRERTSSPGSRPPTRTEARPEARGGATPGTSRRPDGWSSGPTTPR